jgi:ABC-type microcin C transport system duplicated ATPase subunit YejF
MSDAFLQVRDLKVHFPIRTGGILIGRYTPLKAVDGVSFDLNPGETLGVVGESGCGKSTLGRAVLQLIGATDGAVSWLGTDLTSLNKKELIAARENLQIVFQDPLASLDPRMTAGDIIAEPLLNYRSTMSKAERRMMVEGIMERVGLLPRDDPTPKARDL